MRIISIWFLTIFSFNAFANCRLDYEDNIAYRVKSIQRTSHVGKVSSAATFSVVGGFWIYVGVALVGPWGILIGSEFGAIGALPVGASFWVTNKVKKYNLIKMANALSIIIEVDENHPKINTFSYDLLLKNLTKVYPSLSSDQFDDWINYLNESKALCDGTVARFGRKLVGKKKMLADTNDILRYSNIKLKDFLNKKGP